MKEDWRKIYQYKTIQIQVVHKVKNVKIRSIPIPLVAKNPNIVKVGEMLVLIVCRQIIRPRIYCLKML